VTDTNTTDPTLGGKIPLPPDHRGVPILLVEVGSTLHGTGLPGGEDLDIMGVAVPAESYTVGLKPDWGSWHWRTQPEGVRSGPGDVDLAVYSLRKYLALVLDGNPSTLLPLFAPDSHVLYATPLGLELREVARPWVHSLDAGRRFRGYLEGQRRKFTNPTSGGGGKIRRHLVGEHGYDTKYGMHMVRLAYQGVEFLTTGALTLPMDGERAENCRAIRRGEWTKDAVLAEVAAVDAALGRLIDENPGGLRPKADWDAADRWLCARQAEATTAYRNLSTVAVGLAGGGPIGVLGGGIRR
jgi:hypothetical protein